MTNLVATKLLKTWRDSQNLKFEKTDSIYNDFYIRKIRQIRKN
jgi:hypothetical protein